MNITTLNTLIESFTDSVVESENGNERIQLLWRLYDATRNTKTRTYIRSKINELENS